MALAEPADGEAEFLAKTRFLDTLVLALTRHQVAHGKGLETAECASGDVRFAVLAPLHPIEC